MGRKRPIKRRWLTFSLILMMLTFILFIIGLELWELWMAIIVMYYVFWLLRNE
jgi:hypothetical protein